MKKFRIGTDRTILWHITHEGRPYSLEGKDISLKVSARDHSFLAPKDSLRLTGNCLSWTFCGCDQKWLGPHTLTLIENNGKPGMVTVDCCEAFSLVAYSCLADNNSECGAVDTSGIDLQTELKVYGLLGVQPLQEVTYSELVSLRDSHGLVPGKQYRITDYATATIASDTRSAGHPFDVIVVADSGSSLNEKARAALREGDTYFADSDLNAWEIWYCLDNDTARFSWADPVGGKGVIYRMIDEFGNDCPYDFKNIQFKHPNNINTYPAYYYTFTNLINGVISDKSLIQGYCYGNVINEHIENDPLVDKNIQLNRIVFIDTSETNRCNYNSFGNNCRSNSFGSHCSNNSFGNNCYSNSFGNDCDSNIFGNSCGSNSFGDSCDSNIFGNDCNSNSFGNSCFANSFGNDCNSNIFGGSCDNNSFGNNCHSNSFGDNCNYNSFGNTCYSNSFKNSCDSNSFGNSCYSNSFRYRCHSNSFGNNSSYNSFESDCESNSFGNTCDSNIFGSSCGSNSFGDNCSSNIFGNNCTSNSFGNSCDSNSFGGNCNANSLGGNCDSNSFGDNCSYNSFGGNCESNSFGNTCTSNSFGDKCIYNSFGNYCDYNSFGNGCNHNSLKNSCDSNSFGNICSSNSLGGNSKSNSFGNDCNDNSFGGNCTSNSFGNGCNDNSFRSSNDYSFDDEYGDYTPTGTLLNYVKNNHFGDGCNKVVIVHTSTLSSTKYLQNLNIAQGLTSDDLSSLLFVTIKKSAQDYEIEVARNTSGDVKVFTLADMIL